MIKKYGITFFAELRKKRKFIIISFFISLFVLPLLIQSCATANNVKKNEHKKAPARFVFQNTKSELYGIMDEQGDIILKPEYKFIDQRINGFLPAFTTDNYFVFLDNDGKPLGNSKFYDISSFPYKGYLLVKDFKTGKAGIINNQGEYVFSPLYDALNGYPDDETMVAKKGEKVGVINRKGEFIVEIPFKIEQIKMYRNGLIEISKKDVIDFSNDFVPMYRVPSEKNEFKIFDSYKNAYIKLKYDELLRFTENRKIIFQKDSALYVFDTENNKETSVIDDISNNYSISLEEIGKSYYLLSYSDKNNENKLVFFDSNAEIICKKEENFNEYFFDNKKNLSRNDILNYCLKKDVNISPSKEIVMPEYKISKDWIIDNALFACNKQNKCGVIDFKKKIITDFKYDEFSRDPICRKFFRAKMGNKYAVLSKDGQEITKPIYDNVYFYNNYFAKVTREGKSFLLNIYGKELRQAPYTLFLVKNSKSPACCEWKETFSAKGSNSEYGCGECPDYFIRRGKLLKDKTFKQESLK